MSTGQIEVYRAEIFNFLKTVSIKFDPFSYTLGAEYMKEHGYTDINAEWNPYYQNLCGLYAYYDTPIQVYAVEDGNTCVYDKDFLLTHPKSSAMYRIPNEEYDTLCKKYPRQSGLIKCITYPAADIQAVMAAPNLSVVSYDASLLYENERESLITCLNDFLTLVRVRWWIPEYSYEDLYPMAFWMMLWETLPNVLLAQRMQNVHTGSVHPFHIWEYLISHGLGDYRDILTINQALWLYRNLPWVLKNKGKDATLNELAEHILVGTHVDLGGVVIKPNTTDSTVECKTIPELLVRHVETDVVLEYLTTNQLLNKVEDLALTPSTSEDERVEIKDGLANTNKDMLKTKYVEFVKRPMDTKWESLLTEFLFDSTMYRFSTNDLAYNVKFTDTVFGSGYTLYIGDAIALLYYALHRQFKDEVVNVPSVISTRIAYHKNRPQYSDMPKDFKLLGTKYFINSYVNTEGMMDRIPYHSGRFTSQDELIDSLYRQFNCLLHDVANVHSSGNALYHEGMGHIYSKLLVNGVQDISFGAGVTTYADLRRNNATLDTIISIYDNQVNTAEVYTILAKNLMSLIFPTHDPRFSQLIGVASYAEKLYSGLRNLFIQLCSYNITFLDTTRRFYQYFPIPMLLEHMANRVGTGAQHTVVVGCAYVYTVPHTTRLLGDIPMGVTMDRVVTTAKNRVNLEIKSSGYVHIPPVGRTRTLSVPTGLQISISKPE